MAEPLEPEVDAEVPAFGLETATPEIPDPTSDAATEGDEVVTGAPLLSGALWVPDEL